MQYGVLGPLEVVDEGRVVDVGRPKQRALLAVLLLDANHVVSFDKLVELLWGEERPARSTHSLQVYVSNLRRILEPERGPRPSTVLLTRQPGYLLRIERQDLDAWQFEALAAEGRRLLAEGRFRPARQRLEEALALWRGDALADFAYEDFARPSVARWEQMRHVAVEDRIEADLGLGAHDHQVAELESLVVRFPHRERLWGLLMVALYRSGRQGDALRAGARARAVLVEDLGLDPTPDLIRLEADILAHAPALGWRGVPDIEDGRQVNTDAHLAETTLEQDPSGTSTATSDDRLPMSLSLFLCHSKSDQAAVRKLYRRLLQDKFKPWLDEEAILGGQNWEVEISKAVNSSDIVLICLSRNSVNKRGYVQKEIKFALDVADQQPAGTIFLIPLRLEDCDVPERLRNLQWVDLFRRNGYAQLRKTLSFAASSMTHLT